MTSTKYYRVVLGKASELTAIYNVWAFTSQEALAKAQEYAMVDYPDVRLSKIEVTEEPEHY